MAPGPPMELAQPELPSCHGIVSDVAQLPSLATAEDGLRLAWEHRAFGELRRGRVLALPGPLGLGHLLVVLLERALGHQLLHGRVLLLAVPVVLCLGRLPVGGGGGGLLLLDQGGEPVDLGLVAQRHVAHDLRLDVPRHVVRPHRQLHLVRRPGPAFFI